MRYLFCSLSSLGFLYPAMAVARELEDRGHQVAFVADLSQSEVLQRHGFHRIPRGDEDGHSFTLADWFERIPIALQVKHVEKALETFDADVLVGQPLTLGPLIVSRRRTLPYAVLGLASPLWPLDPDSRDREPNGETEARRLWRHQDMLKYYQQACQLFDMDPGPEDFVNSPLLGDLYLAQTIPEFWSPKGELTRRIRCVGSCLWEPPTPMDDALRACIDTARASRRRVLYMQFGRNFLSTNPLEKMYACLGGKGIQVVASVGRCDSPLGDVPENFWVRDFFPQEHVLPLVDLVVSGGNSTVTLGALTHGVPSLILYGGGEQSDLGELCAAAGVAIALPVQNLDLAMIMEALQTLMTDDAYRRRAKALQAAFARYPGPPTAATAIEALVATRTTAEV